MYNRTNEHSRNEQRVGWNTGVQLKSSYFLQNGSVTVPCTVELGKASGPAVRPPLQCPNIHGFRPDPTKPSLLPLRKGTPCPILCALRQCSI